MVEILLLGFEVRNTTICTLGLLGFNVILLYLSFFYQHKHGFLNIAIFMCFYLLKKNYKQIVQHCIIAI